MLFPALTLHGTLNSAPHRYREDDFESSGNPCPAQEHRAAVAKLQLQENNADVGPAAYGSALSSARRSEVSIDTRPSRPGAYFPWLEDETVEPAGCPERRNLKIADTAMDMTQSVQSDPDNIAITGVKQRIYTTWIKDEIEREAACLELPFTIVLLVSFAVLAIHYVRQEVVMTVEQAIVNDVVENANFAWAHNFGHKGINDVNSYADFWSWCRLGLMPLIAPKAPWMYSEELSDAVPRFPGLPTYDTAALPTRWPVPGHRKPVPIRNDYLRYNRIIGGLRFRQTAANASESHCIFPGDVSTFRQWLGKPCTQMNEDLPHNLHESNFFDNPVGVEWFIMDTEDHETLIQRVIDMEDGCTSARAQNRTCLCEWCTREAIPHPWLSELTTRVEISFASYNAQYGIYCMASINFWFSRSGHIQKLVNIKGSWAGLFVRSLEDIAVVVLSGVVWIFSILYLAFSEAQELIEMVHKKPKPWYLTIADDYLGFWNCVDWISVFIAAVICGLFLMLNLSIKKVNEALADQVEQSLHATAHHGNAEQIRAFYGEVEEMTNWELHFRFWLSVYPVVLMLRLFKSFAAQPRLAVVTNTFRGAWDDLVHFALVFLSVYTCMTVNAILFFGQDSLEFATLDRALHSSFRAMLGDWDWEEMKQVGLWKAFLWFFIFMVVMVLLLLNILLTIIMESYGQVKALAENEFSLPQQIQNMFRRYQQSKRGERVRLRDIWTALLSYDNNDDEAMLQSDRNLIPKYLMDVVPGIPWSQALRTLKNSQQAYDIQNDEPFDPVSLQETLKRTEERVDNMLLCSAWLAHKIRGYQSEFMGGSAQDSKVSKTNSESSATGSWGSPTKTENSPIQGPMAGSDDHMEGSLEVVKQIVQEKTMELADGVAQVLAEEVQDMDRRQVEQDQSMQDMHRQLDLVRRLIYKLNQTCEEVTQLACNLEGPGSLESVEKETAAIRNAMQKSNGPGLAVGALQQPFPQKPQEEMPGPRMRRRSSSDPFFNSRFTAAVGGTRDSCT